MPDESRQRAAWPAPGCNLKERDPVSAGRCCLSLARIFRSAELEDSVLLVVSPSPTGTSGLPHRSTGGNAAGPGPVFADTLVPAAQ